MEREDWEAHAAADMEARRRAMEEERAHVSALEERLLQLQETSRSTTSERER